MSSNKMKTVLFVREDSDYKKRDNWDCYDKKRNALNYDGNDPIVAHPPCRLWGNLSHLAMRNPKYTIEDRAKEMYLAIFSLEMIEKNGGILEHPSKSKLFKRHIQDDNKGFLITIDQYDFGHVAHKETTLYIKGISRDQLPPLPPKDTTIHYCEKGKRRSICGNVEGTTRCTQKQREYTPSKLVDWFEQIIELIEEGK